MVVTHLTVNMMLMSEIEKLIDKEMQQLGKSTEIYIDKQNISSIKMSIDKKNMISALKWLEIFERAGDGLDQFIQWRQCSEMTKEDSTKIACLLLGFVCTSNSKGTLKWYGIAILFSINLLALFYYFVSLIHWYTY
ncbi:hypothetical protein NC652_041431 [Populus alba x Populus x berolinensis]|nr:hypothetical protein NC652_041431 [Populus alba x Populus x berolinensis]